VCDWQGIENGKADFKKEAVPLSAAFEEAESLLRSRFQVKGVRLDIDVGTDLFVFAERRSLVHTVVANLLTNALKFSTAGSAVVVDAQPRKDEIVVFVKDAGIGIPDSMLPKLFSFRHKTTRTGTAQERGYGFGLPLVRKVMEGYGGSIEVASNDIATHPEDHVTTVSLTFLRAS
jgi:signal transduction histidine kinase